MPKALSDDVIRFRDATYEILNSFTCMDVIPDSGKVVVFDSELAIKHAFFGLVEHGWNDFQCPSQ